MEFLQLILCFAFCMNLAKSDDGSKWNEMAQKDLLDSLKRLPNLNKAKNVILFLGDGMGISTVTAARLYKAQLTNQVEGTSTLAFEKLPHVALSKTYNIDRQTPDSAATGTAFLGGVKANFGTLGVNSNVQRSKCCMVEGNKIQTILDWSEAEGKSTGIVTSTRITHATPAASYAHTADRDWENDAMTKTAKVNCKDIARQLIEDNSHIEVILGGGRREFLPKADGGKRTDNRNLIQEWISSKGTTGRYVSNNEELKASNLSEIDHLLGLFAMSHLDYAIDREDSNNANDQPSLADLVDTALKILKKNDKGFFLLVEGGRIDHAHHDNYAKRALYDTIAFDEAVELALNNTDEEETIVVVTADHSHVFTMAGYPETGNDILGIVKPVDERYPAKDGLPFLSLVYGNGAGAEVDESTGKRRDFTNVDTHKTDFRFHAAVPLPYETHAAEDVGIFASGPMSHLFHGVHEQNYIAHVMAYASCVGMNKDHCKPKNEIPLSKAERSDEHPPYDGDRSERSDDKSQQYNSVYERSDERSDEHPQYDGDRSERSDDKSQQYNSVYERSDEPSDEHPQYDGDRSERSDERLDEHPQYDGDRSERSDDKSQQYNSVYERSDEPSDEHPQYDGDRSERSDDKSQQYNSVYERSDEQSQNDADHSESSEDYEPF